LKKAKMTAEETQKARLAAKALLYRLIEESPRVLVQDWFKDHQSKIRVRSTVESVLDSHLPKSYDRVVFTEKCNNVFDLMVNYASQGLKWAAYLRGLAVSAKIIGISALHPLGSGMRFIADGPSIPDELLIS
jgi:hypothetical protein